MRSMCRNGWNIKRLRMNKRILNKWFVCYLCGGERDCGYWDEIDGVKRTVCVRCHKERLRKAKT